MSTVITVISRSVVRRSSFGRELAAVEGAHQAVEGWTIEDTIPIGESRVVWLIEFALPFVVYSWPVRVSNLGDGAYKVSRPWFLGEAKDALRRVRKVTVSTEFTAKAELSVGGM